MTDPVIKLTPQERAELFYEVEKRRSLPALLIEKDFWVCWTLQHLFNLPDADKHLVFKGGTSLSKAWAAIERFSEDIDISLSREWLGYAGELDPEAAPSKKKRNQLIDNLAEACQIKIKDEILPHLSERFTEEIGSEGWHLDIDSVDPQTLLFTYPSVMPKTSGQSYVQRIVRIECGARSDRWPISEAKIQSYVAEEFPAVQVEQPSIFVLSIDITVGADQASIVNPVRLIEVVYRFSFDSSFSK
jgi:hypothetical protein